MCASACRVSDLVEDKEVSDKKVCVHITTSPPWIKGALFSTRYNSQDNYVCRKSFYIRMEWVIFILFNNWLIIFGQPVVLPLPREWPSGKWLWNGNRSDQVIFLDNCESCCLFISIYFHIYTECIYCCGAFYSATRFCAGVCCALVAATMPLTLCARSWGSFPRVGICMHIMCAKEVTVAVSDRISNGVTSCWPASPWPIGMTIYMVCWRDCRSAADHTARRYQM